MSSFASSVDLGGVGGSPISTRSLVRRRRGQREREAKVKLADTPISRAINELDGDLSLFNGLCIMARAIILRVPKV